MYIVFLKFLIKIFLCGGIGNVTWRGLRSVCSTTIILGLTLICTDRHIISRKSFLFILCKTFSNGTSLRDRDIFLYTTIVVSLLITMSWKYASRSMSHRNTTLIVC